MDNTRKFPLILSSFWLKIIALLTMTIDHVGLAFDIEPFRYIGRLALPLFCFMIAEGAIHTRSFKKYALRLGVMASVISLAILLSEVVPVFKNNGLSMRNDGVIFIDLLLGAVAVYLLRQNKWYLKLLAILPLAFGVTSYSDIRIESWDDIPVDTLTMNDMYKFKEHKACIKMIHATFDVVAISNTTGKLYRRMPDFLARIFEEEVKCLQPV